MARSVSRRRRLWKLNRVKTSTSILEFVHRSVPTSVRYSTFSQHYVSISVTRIYHSCRLAATTEFVFKNAKPSFFFCFSIKLYIWGKSGNSELPDTGCSSLDYNTSNWSKLMLKLRQDDSEASDGNEVTLCIWARHKRSRVNQQSQHRQ